MEEINIRFDFLSSVFDNTETIENRIEKEVKAYRKEPELEVMEIYTFNDTVKVGIYEDLYIDFS